MVHTDIPVRYKLFFIKRGPHHHSRLKTKLEMTLDKVGFDNHNCKQGKLYQEGECLVIKLWLSERAFKQVMADFEEFGPEPYSVIRW